MRIRSLRLTKEKIRSRILLQLKKQKEEERRRKIRVIKKKLLKEKSFRKAKKIMFYIALGGEVDTASMIREALKLGKIVALPVCQKNRAALRPCLLDDHRHLRRGPYGVLEPAARRYIDGRELDLVIAPGVAFDRKGNRLGRGKGYYDRFLESIPKDTPSIGLAFDLQVLPQIPTSAHDKRVKKLIFA
jgi:5-formyltetrahydrofolate cyclo-ligase